MITDERQAKLKGFVKKLVINFNNLDFLNTALTHRSYVYEADEKVLSNERLEFLGDSVLGLVVTDFLYLNLDKSEGELAKIKSVLVSTRTLAKIAKTLDVGDYLLLGKGEKLSGGKTRASILADAVEAVIGAYYLDAGLSKTKKFVIALLKDEFSNIMKGEYEQDYKSILQVHTQKHYKNRPLYKIDKIKGPEHKRRYFVSVYINNKNIAQGEGNNKKNAEQLAAKLACAQLKLV